jgi:PIN domain nuclease of toxin-antitoxin system
VNILVLDACALIALLQNEAGAGVVAEAIDAARAGRAQVRIHQMNLLEVYYDAYRRHGRPSADLLPSELSRQPITIIRGMSDAVFLEAGRLKAAGGLSLADAIALAETLVSGGQLPTADHLEFDSVEKRENVRIQWIR